ncbi:hypothetical protein N0V87_001650 [Didymella glomerata]|uniref:Monooxygenase n=1 Tax=Didymella glomerata TaxID=749621 RepID=A0A9W9C339_9PLEO|nr:hypothetical protein N0V87_001650 [Didymella glomerata]
MAVKPIYEAFASRPKDQALKKPLNLLHTMIRDQFNIATWLSIGAIIQAAAYTLLPYRNIVTILPVILFLAYKITYTACVATGVLPNPRMKNVNLYRTGPIYPDEKGVQDKAADTEMCAILLGVVSNHPLGMLGPGFKRVGDEFDAMVKQMSNDATRYGYLGHSAWLNAADSTTSSEFMTILYFQNEQYLHDYAHGPMHTETMKWWREVEKEIPHVGISHEVFACPKKSWEGIYINYPPVGLGATTKEVTGPDGKKSWVNPLVKLGGKISYSKGRMGREFGDNEWKESTATMGYRD